MTRPFQEFGSERGLTLLELLLVVLILSSVAWMSLSVVSNDADQIRFEDTRNRLLAIRRAIIGDTARTLNGAPEISGYVADMGGPPPNLHALISRYYCKDSTGVTQTDCEGGGGTWTEQAAYSYNATYGIWVGWNGPYLRAAELSGNPRFLDGWGNDDQANNFGWNYDSPSTGDLTIQSYGRDGEAVATTDDYELEYPPSSSQPYIPANAYRVLITDKGLSEETEDGSGRLRVDFGSIPSCWKCDGASGTTRKTCVSAGGDWKPVLDAETSSACSDEDAIWLPDVSTPDQEDICLVIARREGGSVKTLRSSKTIKTTFTWKNSVDPPPLEFKFEDGTYLNQGQMSFRIFEDDGNDLPANPFPVGMTQWKVFSVVPGSVLQPLKWDLK
jgi:prepilin-type N-terminal cleavage/methylation domain-containing protein